MSVEAILQQVKALSVEEQAELMDRLHEEYPESFPELTDEMKLFLDERLSDADANPDAGIPWEVVKAASLKRIGK